MAEQPGKKKIVRAESKSRSASSDASTRDADYAASPRWRPTTEGLKRARTFRIIALVLWLVAIALEAFAIFGLLNGDNRARIGLSFGWDPGEGGFPTWAMVFLIVLFVVIGVLSVTGSWLWKKANDLDPASKRNPVRLFVQNQLGAIIALIAFLPLIVVVLRNRDMDDRQKTIAGVVGGVVLVAAVLLGIDFTPTSVEQKTAEAQWDQQRVIAMTGKDEVYWVAGGEVYHLCAEVSPLQKTSTAEEIVVGTVQDAVDAGKSRLTKQVPMELKQCNLPQPDEMYLDWNPPANVDELPLPSGMSEDEAPTVPAT